MNQDELKTIAQKQRGFFFTGKTKDIDFRIKNLKILKRAIEKHEDDILDALKKDLGRSSAEAYIGDVGDVYSEIDYAIKNIKKWVGPKKVKTPLVLFPAVSYVYREPYGSVLIIGPWNYPFKLLLNPLVGAMVAGNCAVIKPSELSPNSSKIVADIIKDNFEQEYIAVVEGGVKESEELLSQKFDYIFFTGGTYVGKIVMQAVAKNLTPVTLELGGKSPCIIDEDVNLETAARRIVWGKCFNAGQSCIAPDYILVNKKIKNELLENIKKAINEFYGDNPFQSSDYARIINERHFSRLSELLKEGNIVVGGDTDQDNLYISPTVIDNVSWNSKVMQEEIFGPILPVIEYGNLDEVISILHSKPKPLALYFFSKDKSKQEKILNQISAGGVSINDVMAHIQNRKLPFGGVGDSGMGAYQGKFSFDTFTHDKAVVKKSFFDDKMKYPPYKLPLKYFKKIMRVLG